MSVIDQLKSSSLQKADGANASADCLNGKAVILIYFSAHWCPPCRAFTPMLKDFYEVRRPLQSIAMTTKTNKASIYISGGRRGRRWNYLCVQWQVTTRHGQLYEGKCMIVLFESQWIINVVPTKKESHGDWLAMPHGSEVGQELKKKFGVTGIPCLVVLKGADGTLITKEGRNAVQAKGPAAVKEWK